MTSIFRMRPQYQLRVPLPPEQVRSRVREAIADPTAVCRGAVEQRKLSLRTSGEHHFWSPEMRARLQSDADGSLLVGRFGPKPAVWTMFAVIYFHLALIGISGGIYAMAQLTLDRSPTAMWVLPIALMLAIVVRVVAHIGQSLGSNEMQQIRAFLSDVLDSAE